MSQSNLHVAVIMDGNGRWAEMRGLSRAAGHRAGAEALRRAVEAAPAYGVGALTAYAFSSDNWKRPADEVEALMHLLAWYLESETPRLRNSGVRTSIIGRRDRLPPSLLTAIAATETATSHCERLHLRLAIDYSAREWLLSASDETLLSAPRVDLLIRTGGEQRLSDFLLWECAYAELLFTRRMWPDFDETDLRRAMNEFGRRTRKFGALPPPVSAAAGTGRWLR